MHIIKKISIFALVFVLGLALTACNDKEKEPEKEKEVKKEDKISLIAVGDNLIHDTVYADAEQEDGTYDFSKMYEEFAEDASNADIAFINQETILGGEELGLSGYPVFNSPTEIAKNLEDAGFNLANMATNHCLDKGGVGVENALDAFDETSIVHDGVYRSEEEYDAIPTFEKKGVTFSFLAYTYDTNGIYPDYDYRVSYFDDAQITRDVKEAKKVSDVVIVSAHWGDENVFEPNDFQKHYAKLFADLGVDVVIGTHPHVIQPIRWVKGENGNKTLVAYSLGNFIGGMQYIENAIGGELCLDFVKNENGKVKVKNVKFVPTFIHFEGNSANFLEERWGYKTYHLSDYTEELAEKHVYNGYEGQTVTLDYINSVVTDVIDEKYLK